MRKSTCMKCGSEFIHSVANRKYCSRECYLKNGNLAKNLGDWTTPEKIAIRNKDRDFRQKVSNGVKKYHKKNPVKLQRWFIDTYGENYKPKSSYYIPGVEWRKNQKIINAKNICQRCGNPDNLNVHHIIPYSISKDNSPSNLVPLCKSCHRIVESNNTKIKNIIGDWFVLKALYKNHLLDNNRIWDATT